MSSRRWFVHINEPYYPSGWIVDALNEGDAIAKAWALCHSGPEDEDRIAIVVAPFEGVKLFGKLVEVQQLAAHRETYEYADGGHSFTTLEKSDERFDVSPLPPGIYQAPTADEIEQRRSWMMSHATSATFEMPKDAA